MQAYYKSSDLDLLLDEIVQAYIMNHLNLKFGQKVHVKTYEEDFVFTVIGVASRGLQDSYILEFPDGITRLSFENFGQEPIQCRAIVLSEGLLIPVTNAENFIRES